MAIDREIFSDFIEANRNRISPDLVQEAEEFFDRLVIANKIYKAAFGNVADHSQNVGEMQGTFLLLKLQTETVSPATE